ncbi:MAG: FAD-binding oxidoreductase [Candidatus Nanoperiomorbaceae bacterium]
MSKITSYLRQHLAGEVRDDASTRNYFSSDEGIFTAPSLFTIYPRTTNDVRKSARFAWRMAERGAILPLVARGLGLNRVSAAVGDVTLALPAHMARILEFDPKLKLIRVQPGLTLAALNEAAATYGLKFRVSDDNNLATIGGLLGSNAPSRTVTRYGAIGDQVDRVEVVLSNGEVIQTGRLNKRELSAKKGLQTMEGEIYRAVDALIDENADRVADLGDNLPFALNRVKTTDDFDLTPLFIGSEGTLGVITQVILRLDRVSNDSVFIATALHEQSLADVADQLSTFEPSELSFITGGTLNLLERLGDASWHQLTDSRPSALVFAEFDDHKSAKKAKKALKALTSLGVDDVKLASDFEDQATLRSMRDSPITLTNFNEHGVVAPAIGADLRVQPSRLPEFIEKVQTLFAKAHIEGGVWGDLSAGVVNAQPLLNPTNFGQKQAMIKLITELRLAANDFSAPEINQTVNGRLGSIFISELYDKDALKLFADVKIIFDPFGILNPGVKFGLTNNELANSIKSDLTHDRFLEF